MALRRGSSGSSWRLVQLVVVLGCTALLACWQVLLRMEAEQHGPPAAAAAAPSGRERAVALALRGLPSGQAEGAAEQAAVPRPAPEPAPAPALGAAAAGGRAPAEVAERLARAREAEAARRRALGRAAAEEAKALVGGAPPVPPLSEPGPDTPIVLEISAFLDGQRCGRTLGLAFERADQPARVSAFVLQARSAQDVDCLRSFKEKHIPRLCGSAALQGRLLPPAELDRGGAGLQALCAEHLLRRIHAWAIPPQQGMGPVHQRGLANTLLRVEDERAMCLSMDSHMGFMRGWDRLLIQEWSSVRNEFAVLTVYPMDIASMDEDPKRVRSYSHLCGYEKEKSAMEPGMPRGRAPYPSPRREGERPHLTMNWAAGFSFHRCHAERVVPADVHLRWTFSGEEANRAVRLWTHGYDMYIPTVPIVTHEYKSAKQQFWKYKGTESNVAIHAAQRRQRRLLRMGGEGSYEFLEAEPPYALGDQRTMEQFVNWSRQEFGETWGPWLRSHGIQPQPPGSSGELCKKLERWPVRDEAELVASVAPQPPERGAARLSSFPRGRLELWDGARWGTLCRLPWAETDRAGPSGLCQQLGYGSGMAFLGGDGGSRAEDEGVPIVAGNRECRGTEASPLDCPVAPGASPELAGCTHAEDVGLHCLEPRNVPEEVPQRHGCCQVSTGNKNCAYYEYADNKCCDLNVEGCQVPMCQRGHWAKTSDYDPVKQQCVPNPSAAAAPPPSLTDPEPPPIPVH